MQQELITLAVAGVSVAGTLGAVFLSQSFSRRSELEQWERNKKTEEYRELIDALTNAYLDNCQADALGKLGLFRETDDEILPTDIEMTAYRVLRNRLFTATELETEDVIRRWDTALINFKRIGDARKFADRFDSIVATIVWLSTKKGSRPKHL